MTPDRLARALLLLILGAAVATAPVFLVAEGFSGEHVVRVLASNGVTAAICGALLVVLRRRGATSGADGDAQRSVGGAARLVGRLLVVALLALVATLAWTNGEEVHVNVVNFVFVTVLANALLPPKGFLAVAATCAAILCGIALKQPVAAGVAEPLEARLESIGQFLPTFSVIVAILALRDRLAPRAPPDERPRDAS